MGGGGIPVILYSRAHSHAIAAEVAVADGVLRVGLERRRGRIVEEHGAPHRIEAVRRFKLRARTESTAPAGQLWRVANKRTSTHRARARMLVRGGTARGRAVAAGARRLPCSGAGRGCVRKRAGHMLGQAVTPAALAPHATRRAPRPAARKTLPALHHQTPRITIMMRSGAADWWPTKSLLP